MADHTTGARRNGTPGPARAAAPAPRPGSSKPGKKPQPVWRRRLFATLKGLVIAGLVIALLGVAGIAVAYVRTDMPDPNAAFLTNKSNVYYRDGSTLIGSFADQNRTTIPYSQMPASIKDAVVAAENRSFWTDKGISPTGILRAVYGILRGTSAGGGSTITQEYIKILYLTSEPTASRNASEGQRWVYFLTPWGMQLELVSYPAGKAYQRAGGPVLWHPARPAE